MVDLSGVHGKVGTPVSGPKMGGSRPAHGRILALFGKAHEFSQLKVRTWWSKMFLLPFDSPAIRFDSALELGQLGLEVAKVRIASCQSREDEQQELSLLMEDPQALR